MASHKDFLEEKEKIDELIRNGYQIVGIRENLSGALVEFAPSAHHVNHTVKNVELHILTADARKYFSTIIIANQKKLVH